jgi:hypothetical protein
LLLVPALTPASLDWGFALACGRQLQMGRPQDHRVHRCARANARRIYLQQGVAPDPPASAQARACSHTRARTLASTRARTRMQMLAHTTHTTHTHTHTHTAHSTQHTAHSTQHTAHSTRSDKHMMSNYPRAPFARHHLHSHPSPTRVSPPRKVAARTPPAITSTHTHLPPVFLHLARLPHGHLPPTLWLRFVRCWTTRLRSL